MTTPEEKVAVSIGQHRTAKGLTYEQLSALMRVEGVQIHPSAIQKTEKSGRKPTISEINAYASVFGVPIESLWGGEPRSIGVDVAKADLKYLTELRQILNDVRDRYNFNLSVFASGAYENSRVEEYLEKEMRRFRDANAEEIETYASDWSLGEMTDDQVADFLLSKKRLAHPRVVADALRKVTDQRSRAGDENGE